MCIHIYTHRCIHMYTYTYMYTHIYMYINIFHMILEGDRKRARRGGTGGHCLKYNINILFHISITYIHLYTKVYIPSLNLSVYTSI
jgi:hypothetical protein